MALQNTIGLPSTQGNRRNIFRNGGKSLTATAGDNVSIVIVPAGEVWELNTLRVVNGDTVARDVQLSLTDADGTEQAVLSMTAQARQSIATTGVGSWNGSILVPGGWRVSVKWYALALSTVCSWQFIAIAQDTKAGTDVTAITL